MIEPNKIKKSQARYIIRLLEEQTRAEIMSRLGPVSPPDFAEYHSISIHKMDKLRRYIFGTDDLVQLGYRWGLLKKKKKRKKR